MSWLASREFSCRSTDPADARRFTVAELTGVLGVRATAELLDDASLVVSELLTNAVRATCQRIVLQLQTVAEGLLQIAVIDDGAGWPTPQSPNERAEHGRGLQIVSVLARSWGVEHLPDGRKRVWARLSVPERG